MSIFLGKNPTSGIPQMHVSTNASISSNDNPSDSTVFHSDFNPLTAEKEYFTTTTEYFRAGPYGTADDIKVVTLNVPIDHKILSLYEAGCIAIPLKSDGAILTYVDGTIAQFAIQLEGFPFASTINNSIQRVFYLISGGANYGVIDELAGVLIFNIHRNSGAVLDFREEKVGALPGIHITKDTFTVNKYDYSKLRLVAFGNIPSYERVYLPNGQSLYIKEKVPSYNSVTFGSTPSRTFLKCDSHIIFDTSYNYIPYTFKVTTPSLPSFPTVRNSTAYRDIIDLNTISSALFFILFTYTDSGGVNHTSVDFVYKNPSSTITLAEIGSYYKYESGFWWWEDDFYATGSTTIELTSSNMIRAKITHAGDGSYNPTTTLTQIQIKSFL